MSATNGVTGVDGIEVQARLFRDSGMNENLRVSIFHPLSPVTPLRFVPGCHFLLSALSYLFDLKTFSHAKYGIALQGTGEENPVSDESFASVRKGKPKSTCSKSSSADMSF